MSCNYNRPIPNPPTTSTACSVPIGGNNNTILDTCCNGEANPFTSYGAPGEQDCYTFCTTDAGSDVQECLNNALGNDTAATNTTFMCYNVVEGKAKSYDNESAAPRTTNPAGKAMMIWMGLVVVGMVVAV